MKNNSQIENTAMLPMNIETFHIEDDFLASIIARCLAPGETVRFLAIPTLEGQLC